MTSTNRQTMSLDELVKASEAWIPEALGRALQTAAARLDPKVLAMFNPKAVCEEARSELGAASIVVYADDPVYRGDYRVVAMTGIKYPEVMDGFLGRPAESSKQLITCGTPEEYVTEVRDSEGLGEELSAILDKYDEPKRRLFANFVQREGVLSRARLVYPVKGRPTLALFVNFDKRQEFAAETRRRIRELYWTLVEHLLVMTARLNHVDRRQARRILSICSATHQLTEPGIASEVRLRECLNGILHTALDAFGILDSGLGTIHLYHRETGTLHLFAYQGRMDFLDDALAQSVHDPDRPGVIAFAALKGKAIRIEDLETSPYGAICRHVLNGSRSEVAAPMLVGESDLAPPLAAGAVVGVINLESTQPGKFKTDSVRALWHAAIQAALAVCYHRERAARRKSDQLRDRLYEWYQRAADQCGEGSLDQLAGIASDSLDASRCDLWHYNARTGRFASVASSHPDGADKALPRTGPKKGWSDYVRRTGWPVWISNVKDERHFDALYWNPERRAWQSEAPAGDAPDSINPHMLEIGVECELGIPIVTGKQCVGVAWLKYNNIKQRLSADDLTRAAGAAAMVLYKNAKGPLFTLSQGSMLLARQFTEQAALRRPYAN
ncbi:MAG TPA: GAF domain-containing protein [Gemmataceae bacterium]|nr:GAF domain-containing protein [Gemmataceae bacterium]